VSGEEKDIFPDFVTVSRAAFQAKCTICVHLISWHLPRLCHGEGGASEGIQCWRDEIHQRHRTKSLVLQAWCHVCLQTKQLAGASTSAHRSPLTACWLPTRPPFAPQMAAAFNVPAKRVRHPSELR